MTKFRTSDRDVNRAIRSWLHEDRHEDASRIAGAVLDQVEATPERRATSWPAWRTPTMNKIVTYGLAAAAVVVALIVGSNLIGSPSSPPGGSPSDSAESSGAEPSTAPSAQAAVEPGPHIIWEDAPGVGSITLTIPNGWDLHATDHYLTATDFNNVGILVFAGDLWVYEDPCHWSTTLPDTPATTADELINALASQASRNASDPADIAFENEAVQRYVGQSITLHVPDDAVLSDCDDATFGTLTEPGFDVPTRSAQGPGQIDEFLVVEVEGVPVAFDLTYWDDTPTGVIDEMRAIAESAVYGSQ